MGSLESCCSRNAFWQIGDLFPFHLGCSKTIQKTSNHSDALSLKSKEAFWVQIGDRLGNQGAAGMGLDSKAAWRKVDSVNPAASLFEVVKRNKA